MMPRTLLALVLTTVIVAPAAGQATAPQRDAQLEIEKDVWVPLLAASSAFDADGFLAIQSRDLVRVSVDRREVYGLAQYRTEIQDGFRRARTRGIERTSEVRFLERAVSGDLAYEAGYFRSRVRLPGGEEQTRYSRFEFVLRKEDGRWRILVDKDTAAGGTITDEQFQAAAPMTLSREIRP